MTTNCIKFTSADFETAKGVGSISTLTFDLDITVEPSANPMAPTHRVLGRSPRGKLVECGGIWKKQNKKTGAKRPLTFLLGASKWHRHLKHDEGNRLCEVAVLCHLRDAFRASDIWLIHPRRYGDLKDALVPTEVARPRPSSPNGSASHGLPHPRAPP